MSVLDQVVEIGASALLPHLDRWRPTTRGKNPWSLEGLRNVLRLEAYFARVVNILGGRVTSCYRSREINALVGGVPDSYHVKGAALDVIGWNAKFPTVDAAAQAVFEQARAGTLGPVREVIPEQRTKAVHVDWWVDGRTSAPRLVRDERY